MNIKDVPIHAADANVALMGDPGIPVNAPVRLWQRIALIAILLLAAFLNFFQIQQNGYGNTYYAAAVRSMLTSWHNFFFVSFDPGGFVTVDKPPLALWVQTASAALFGFSGFSLLLPQAIAGIISVYILYRLVQRTFGPIAGLLAALALAITPISVVMNRDNNMDTLLVLTLLLATWCVMKATEAGSLRWLILCAALVGLGFNIKTLEAYLVVPAFGLLYLLGSPVSWGKRIWHLALALLIMLVISLSWLVAVDLTPASQRPYVGSSQTNSEIELALGYNGLQRLTGMGRGGGGGGARPDNARAATTPAAARSTPSANVADRPANGDEEAGNPFAGGGNPFNGGGPPSVWRMFMVELGGQVSWLLPLALVSLLALGWQTRLRLPLSRQHQALVLWGVWLLTTGIFFSVAGFFHSYYLVMIAPAIAALSGIGLVLLWRAYRSHAISDWRTWILPLALLLTAAEQVYLLLSYTPWNSVLTPLILALCLLSACILIFAKIRPGLRLTQIIQRPALTVGMLALLITPAIWSGYSTLVPGNSTLPTGGPNVGGGANFGRGGAGRGNDPQANRGGGSAADRARNGAGIAGPVGPGGPGGMGFGQSNSKMVSYLEANQGTSRYMLAVQSSMSASSIIIATGKPVMAMGGFSGGDPILNQQKLADMVKAGTVRFFLLQGVPNASATGATDAANTRAQGANARGGPFGNNNGTTSWVQQNCKTVASDLWQTSTSNAAAGRTGNQAAPGGGPGGFGGGGEQLYDCSAVH